MAFGDLEQLIPRYRAGVAFPIGAMGSRQANFYRAAFRRAGYEDACDEVSQLWLAGQREEATAKVPDEMVIRTTLLGDDAQVKDRIRAYARAGITTLRLQPDGGSVTQRVDTLARGRRPRARGRPRVRHGLSRRQLIWASWPSQNGARSSRLSTLPGPDLGNGSSRSCSDRGTL